MSIFRAGGHRRGVGLKAVCRRDGLCVGVMMSLKMQCPCHGWLPLYSVLGRWPTVDVWWSVGEICWCLLSDVEDRYCILMTVISRHKGTCQNPDAHTLRLKDLCTKKEELPKTFYFLSGATPSIHCPSERSTDLYDRPPEDWGLQLWFDIGGKPATSAAFIHLIKHLITIMTKRQEQ